MQIELIGVGLSLHAMIEIGRTIVSEEVFEEEFVCNLTACKGACCVEGTSGAPLLKEEVDLLKAIVEEVKPFLPEAGRKALDEQGAAIIDSLDDEWVTPLVNGAECAYTVFDEKNTALCGIELAHKAGKIDFLKPLSCHLYPIRITHYKSFDAINYHRWEICNPACTLGQELKVSVFDFLKAPLIRAYGQEWYNEASEVRDVWKARG